MDLLFAAREPGGRLMPLRGFSSIRTWAAGQQHDLANETPLDQSAAMRLSRRRIRERPTRRRSIPPGSPMTALEPSERCSDVHRLLPSNSSPLRAAD
jgi:hypothetical protein